MKIFFTASVSAKDKYLDKYNLIIKYLLSKKHQVISDHITKPDEKSILESSREDVLQFHSKLEGWIKSCDFVLAETSFPSISVGYELSLAVRLGKPILILYSTGGPPSIFTYHRDEKVICEKYTEQTFKDIIDDFVAFVEQKHDLRFTFFITPDIALYLDEVAKTEKLPKSVYLRKLIEKDMRNKM
jgi:hypothetical protein